MGESNKARGQRSSTAKLLYLVAVPAVYEAGALERSASYHMHEFSSDY